MPIFKRRSLFTKRKTRYKKPYFPKLKSGDNLHFFELQCAITEYFKSVDKVRSKLNKYVTIVGDRKALLNSPQKFMERLKIDKPPNELTQLNMLVKAAYIEQVLGLPELEVEYPILASVPKGKFKEVWEKALQLRDEEGYPTIDDVKNAINEIKAIRDSNNLDEYIADIL